MLYKYKYKGIFWPYSMQFVINGYLVIFWTLLLYANPNPVITAIFALFSIFIIMIHYYSYPSSFKLTPEGLTFYFSFGQSLFIQWDSIKDFKVSGSFALIRVSQGEGIDYFISNYKVFLKLLRNGNDFQRILDEKIGDVVVS